MMRPNLLLVAVAFLFGLAIVLALVLTDKAAGEHLEPATTTDTTPSTTWLETQPTLPETFDTMLAGVARAKAAHRPKRVQHASARPAIGGAPYPTDQLLEQLARCETGGKMDNPNTGNGYYGFFQFDLPTWREVGGVGYPHEHSYGVQRDHARTLILTAGWGRFPSCSRTIGAR